MIELRSLAMAVLMLLTGLSGTAPALAADDASRLPIRAFVRHPDILAVQLSPSGRWLALTTGSEGKRIALAVVDLEGKEAINVVANFSDVDVRSFRWVNDDRLVFNTIDFAVGAGEQRFGPGLYSVRRDGSEQRQLIRGEGYLLREARAAVGREPLAWNHELLAVPRDGGNEVIVGSYQLNAQYEVQGVNALRLDITTGRTVSLAGARPDHAVRWWFDTLGNPRVIATLYQGESAYWWKGEADAPWRQLAAFPADSAPYWPVFIDAKGTLYVSQPTGERGIAELKRYDFAAGRPEAQAIVSTPGFDFAGRLITDSEGGRVFGISLATDAAQTVWFDARLKAIQKLADERFPGHVNTVSCARCDDPKVVLVSSYSDRDPGSIWVYRPADSAWQEIGKVRKDIDPKAMATLDFHRIKARDGEDLPLWVTARPAAKGAAPRPAILLVHGGPWVRGTDWHWDGQAQFLASRGYVVIEPEFRGGTGFGSRHFEQGWKHWGDTMQDDLADAVAWAGAQGVGRPGPGLHRRGQLWRLCDLDEPDRPPGAVPLRCRLGRCHRSATALRTLVGERFERGTASLRPACSARRSGERCGHAGACGAGGASRRDQGAVAAGFRPR